MCTLQAKSVEAFLRERQVREGVGNGEAGAEFERLPSVGGDASSVWGGSESLAPARGGYGRAVCMCTRVCRGVGIGSESLGAAVRVAMKGLQELQGLQGYICT